MPDAEFEVMRVLWDAGPSSVRQVLTHLEECGRRLASTTVQTFLARLARKGFVRADRSGTAFRFRALVSRERVSRSRLKSLLEQLYDGAAGPLVLQLVKDERLKTLRLSALVWLMVGGRSTAV